MWFESVVCVPERVWSNAPKTKVVVGLTGQLGGVGRDAHVERSMIEATAPRDTVRAIIWTARVVGGPCFVAGV